MVAEKPSICNSIAHALVENKDDLVTKRGTPPVHVFPGRFKGSRVLFKVTSVTGHVFSCDFPAEYQNWNSTDPVDLFRAPIKRIPCARGVVRLLENEAKGCDTLVLWLDCDREGENICYEVIDCVKKSLARPADGEQQIYRAKFSAINPSDIKKAMANLGQPNKAEALAVDARQELDLKVGVAFSRFQTRYFQGRYSGLDASVVSYGPCQTPTLGFCVKRYVDIQNFQPEPFWALKLEVRKQGSKVLNGLWSKSRVFDQTLCTTFHAMAVAEGCVRVTSVKEKSVKRTRPTPLNTVELLKLASKLLGIGPHSCMQAAERLYLQGILSYPRTESTAYPASFDINGALRQQLPHPYWGDYVGKLLEAGYTKPKGGKDMGDHPPITPCRLANPNELHGDEERVYELVTRQFLASVSPDAVFWQTTLQFAAGNHQTFSATGRKLVSAGFLDALKGSSGLVEAEEGEEDLQDTASFPDFKEGDVLSLTSKVEDQDTCAAISIKEGVTSPPGYLTEAELISLMERNGIGTDASIPTHINNICKRNYVTLESGRRLLPTQLGIVLVQGYHRIDSDLVLPLVRSAIEEQCNHIAKGEANKEEVVDQALSNFIAKFEYFRDNITKMEELFSTSFATIEAAGQVFTRCGFTKRFLNFIKGPPARLYNKFTETVYSLPQGGAYKQSNGRTCEQPGCNFELVYYSVGSPERTYPLCPYCYNNPLEEWGEIPEEEAVDEESKKPRGLCLSSPHPDGHPLIKSLKVSDDPLTGGVFVLDVKHGNKWQFVSTRGNLVLWFPKGMVKKVTMMKKLDEKTNSHYVKVEFTKPMDNGETVHIGCPATDKWLQGLLKSHQGTARKEGRRGRGGRGRGRGRGRGGGGRGRRRDG